MATISEGLAIGRMAELNCVSTRTLRVYDEKGILVPSCRDESSGYRRYALDQCATLDAIQQLQLLGFSLDEIKGQLDTGDAEALLAQLEVKERELAERIDELGRSLRMLGSLKDRCALASNQPRMGVFSIEELPERRAVRFAVHDQTMLRTDVDAKEVLLAWQMTVCDIKRQLLDRGYPLSYFRNVACCIPKEHLDRGIVSYSQALVFIDGADEHFAAEAETIPGGRYLTRYCSDLSTDEGALLESINVKLMLDCIGELGYRVAGDYIGEVVLDTALFGYSGRDELVRMQIPIAW